MNDHENKTDVTAESETPTLPLETGKPSGEVTAPLAALESETRVQEDAPAKKKKSVAGFFKNLLKPEGGKSGACTCGRKPGVQGRHKKTCALFGDGEFAAPDVSDTKPAVADDKSDSPGTAAVARVEQSAAPKNHSFYRKLAERFIKNRSRYKVLRKEEQFEPFLGEEEARKLASEYGLTADEITELGTELEAAAKDGDWPEFSPLLAFGVLYLEIELRWKISDWLNNRRLKKIAEARGTMAAPVAPAVPNVPEKVTPLPQSSTHLSPP